MLYPPRQGRQERGRLDDLRVTGSTFGAMIPQVQGEFGHLAGIIIEATDLVEHSSSQGGGKSTSRPSSRVYSYSVSLAVLVCEGPITAIKTIRGEDRLIYDEATSLLPDNVRIYLGTEQQIPDSLMESIHGVGNVPAYRGTAYVVFEDFDLSPWGNRIPAMTFDVVRANYRDAVTAEDGLQAYYRFSLDIGQMQDSGPNNYDLTDTGSTSSTTTGRVDTGIIVPVTTDLRHNTGAVAALEPAALTVEAWYKYKGGSVVDGSGRWQYVNPTSGEYAWRLTANPNIFTATLNVQFSIFTNASGVTTVHNYVTTRDTDWHHAAVVYDTTGNSLLYVDGVLVDTVTAPVADLTITADANDRLQIQGNDIYWDEAAVYNSLLSAEAVSHHFSLGTGDTTVRVLDILEHQFAQAGLDNTQWDVAEATDEVRGFFLGQRQDPRATLDPVLRCYSTDLIEVDGTLKALRRGGESVITIPVEDMGAHLYSAGGEPAVRIDVKLMNKLEMPRRLDLNYFLVNKQYEQGSEGAIRPTKDYVQESLSVSTPLAMVEDEARQIAEKLLYQIWHEGKQFSFPLPPRYLYLSPGDVLDVPIGDNTLRVRAIGVDYAPLGPVSVTAVQYDEIVLTQNVSGAEVIDSGEETAVVTDTLLVAYSGNALRNDDADDVGLYLAAAGATEGFWEGCQVWMSLDGGTTYVILSTITDPATLGSADNVLAAGTGTAIYDNTGTVNVTLVSGSIASTSDDALLNGDNAFLLGNEVFMGGTIAAVDADTFTITHLIRGQRGTDGHWSEHIASEKFVALVPGQVTRVALGSGLKGKRILLKAVTFGQDIGDVTAQEVYITGDEFKCYSPVDFAAARDGGNNITYTWSRRDRKAEGLRDNLDEVMSESPEAYEVHVLSGTQKTITGITKSVTPTVSSTAHGFLTNDKVFLTGIVGMTQLNGRVATVTSAAANTYTIDIETDQFDTYVSGGTAEKVVRVISASTETAAYSSADQVTDGFSPPTPIRATVFQLGVYGRGYPAMGSPVAI